MFRVLACLAAAVLLLFGGTAAAAPARVSLDAYGSLPAVQDVTLSPSGKRIAYVTAERGTQRVVVTSDAGDLLFSGELGDAKVAGVEWVGDERLMLTKRDTVNVGYDFGGRRWELLATMSIDLRTRKVFWIFQQGKRMGAVLGNFGYREIDGRWYGFFAGLKSIHDPVALYKIDLETGDQSRVAEMPDFETDWLIGPAGEIVARSEYQSSNGAWRLMEGKSARKLMERKDLLQGVSLDGFGRTRESVVVYDEDEDGPVAWDLPLAGGETKRLGEGLALSGSIRDRSGLLIGLVVEGDDRFRFLDPRLQARWRGARRAFPQHEVSLVSWTSDLGRLIIFTDGGGDSGTYWLVDIATGRADDIARAYPAIGPSAVASTRMFKYRAADGLEMEGVLTLPVGRGPTALPVVVLPHGGPIAGADRPGFDWWAQAFAARGYAVFQPNFRGTLGYGAAFRRAAYGEWGARMQTDISDGLAALAREGVVDPRRACIVGGSYGGYAALAGVTLQQGLYRCAASWGGVADLKQMLSYTADRNGRRSEEVRWWRLLMGAEHNNDARLAALSPTRQAERADAPILLIHGKDDTIVPSEQSRAMERALRRAGKPVQYLEMQGEDHWLSRPETRRAMLEAMVSFVETHNPPS